MNSRSLGEGLKTFFTAFNFSRLANASAALGIAQTALEKALSYLKQRKIGTRVATEFQGIRWKLAEMNTHLEAARLVRNLATVLEKNLISASSRPGPSFFVPK